MPFIKRTFPILFAIFLLSVAVRVPQLGRPLSNHHEFCTAVSLRVMQIWYDNGIENYNYNPVMNYNNEADKFINNHANQTGKMVDKEGNYYYVSHPPFAYYLPYAIFKALHIRPDVLPLQIINLFLHFISALFIYFTVCLLSFNRARSLPYRSALVAYSIYLFMPATLWFQGNVYMSDMLVHTFFVIGVYTALKMIIRQKFYSPKYIFFYVLCLGLMIYTSWLGLFFAFGVLVYSLLHVRSIAGFRVLIWSTIIVTLVMLRLITYQYAQIAGPLAYLEEMLSRYIERGSLAETNQGLFHFMFDYLWLIKTLLYNYIINYILVYIAIIAFVYIVMTRKKMQIVFSENGYRFIWLSVMPVVLLHVFFLNYSVHDFTTLYGSLFFSVLLGILFDKVKKSGTVPVRTMRIGVVVLVLLLVGQYEVMNMRRGNSETVGKLFGTTNKSEVIFTNDKNLDPQAIFYAGRNVRYEKDTINAKAFLLETKRTKGAFFFASGRSGDGVILTKPYHLSLDTISP